MFRKPKLVNATLIAKDEEVRRSRGELASGIIQLDRVKSELAGKLEQLMSSMIAETHKGRGRDD